MTNPKATLRTRLLAARARLDAGALAAAAAAVTDHLLAAPIVARAGTVAAYVPVGSEPGSLALLDELRRRGVTVLLPVVVGARELDWSAYDGRLVAGPRGLREPAGARLGAPALARADVVLVPALAVDRAGRRLGRGAGYYDRALAEAGRPGPSTVAVLHDGELLTRVPVEAHDRPVGAAVTPAQGWVELPSRVDGTPPGGHHG